jgi:hypothetical protein
MLGCAHRHSMYMRGNTTFGGPEEPLSGFFAEEWCRGAIAAIAAGETRRTIG